MAKSVAPGKHNERQRAAARPAERGAPTEPASTGGSAGDAIDETLWALADQALAIAWREAVLLDALLERNAAPRTGRSAAATRSAQAASGQSLLVLQALARAAGMRGLSLIAAPGTRVHFDPLLHDLERGAARPGQLVRIRAPAVVREAAPAASGAHGARNLGDAATQIVVKAIATPIPPRR